MKKVAILGLVLFSLNSMAMEAGRYEAQVGDGSKDILVINKDGSMSLEHTRQVGGAGGLTNEGVVPYPTVCRVKEWGKITADNTKYADYEVKFVHLTDLTGLRDTENCERYVGEFNGRALTGSVRFSIQKADFKKQ